MEKKLQPKLRFKEFTGEWKRSTLEKVVKINMGQSPDSKSYNDDKIGLPLIQGNADIQNRVSAPRNYTSSPTKTCDKGDILMTVRAPVGAIAKSLHHACIGRGVCSIKSSNDFIYQFLLDFEEKWDKFSQGSTFTAVNSSDIKGLKIVIPPLPEQEKIASFLSSVDSKIEKLEKKRKLLSQYKKGIMQKIFSQEIRFSDENGKDYPQWVEKKLGEVSKIKTGNKDTQDRIENGKYPFYVRSNTIERINSYSFDGEAILTAGDGVGVGKVFHYLNEKFDYHQRVYNIHNFNDETCGKYIFYYFSKYFYRRVMKLSAKNSVDSVRMEMISKMIIPFPCLEEQEKIANFLSSIDKKIGLVEREVEKNKAFKKGLLQQMFV